MNKKLWVKISLFGNIGEKGAKNGQIFNYNSRPQFLTQESGKDLFGFVLNSTTTYLKSLEVKI